MLHVLERALRGDDAGALDQLVAEGVVAVPWVLTRVPILGRLRHRLAHAVEHLARELQVEQRVDQQRLAAVDDQAGIAASPSVPSGCSHA